MERRPAPFLTRLISRRRVERAPESYDPGSGQVFSETHCSMTSMVPSWVTATTGSVADLINFRDPDSMGAACLEQVAIRSVLLQLDSLDYEAISCVPWAIGRRIWAQIRRYRLDSLRIWRIFVRAYPDERHAFQETRKIPLLNSNTHHALDEIVKQITAPSFEWVTHLTLQDPRLSKHDWAQIPNIRNLGALTVLGASSDSLDDRVVRGWSEAAKDGHVFLKLRVVFFIGQPYITARSLASLRKFPALTLCNLTSCDVDLDQAEDLGWKFSFLNSKAHELNLEWTMSSNVHDAMRAYYRRASSPTLASPAGIGTDEEPILSVFKRSTPAVLPPEGMALWVWRSSPTENGDDVTEEHPTTAEPPKKKRRLRATKEKAIGDVLGSFGI
ncbi:cbs domain-containing protein [Diplodia corticola]|uniref:Cbs domain-containing protein n=1 Tax=Diplodia corticola TaxID=236234 RepID=A0A1J9R253_9PEZI|nr:cbs domain-containing protein [Diplodia corticola]OJD34665.1 cbs domain-containing protein [Diplodia corticola]